MSVAGDVLGQVWRDEWGRLLALLVARYQRLDLAEDALADAFETAARRWPVDGTPDNPAAWLLTAARRRVLDKLRGEAVAARKEPLLLVEARRRDEAGERASDPAGQVGGDPPELGDELLRLVLLCAHPALGPEAASALTLRLVLGVPTSDIARLFLVPEATMAARLTRAKRKLVRAGVALRVPEENELPERVAVLADVAYLAFTAGYAPATGADLVRVGLAGEAVRLVRLVARLLPEHDVLRALLALVLLQHSRRDARTDDTGRPVLLPDQDRTRWYTGEITEALAILQSLVSDDVARSRADAGGEPESRLEQYLLQALIAAEHAIAADAASTRWDVITTYYDRLEALTGSPVVRLNRAVAVAERDGPAAGLALLEGLDSDLPHSHRLAGVRAELLVRAGDPAAARRWFDEAVERCGNEVERQYLRARRDEVGPTAP